MMLPKKTKGVKLSADVNHAAILLVGEVAIRQGFAPYIFLAPNYALVSDNYA